MHIATNISSQLSDFIKKNYYIPSDTKLDEIKSLLAHGILDSTGVLELVTFVEGQFGIAVNDEELVPWNFDSLQALSSFVERKVGLL
jgi:acyl carrier protein